MMMMMMMMLTKTTTPNRTTSRQSLETPTNSAKDLMDNKLAANPLCVPKTLSALMK
jgi:hypothetical protein